MANFKKLIVWQKAHALTIDTYHACEQIKGSPATIVRDQLLRAVLSIGANIAEGSGKGSDREYARFLRIALGSATEVENHLAVARDLELIPRAECDSLDGLVEEVRKMLTSFINRLTSDAQAKPRAGQPNKNLIGGKNVVGRENVAGEEKADNYENVVSL